MEVDFDIVNIGSSASRGWTGEEKWLNEKEGRWRKWLTISIQLKALGPKR